LIKKGQTLEDLKKLRDLATWYREFAEKAGSTTIWDARLRTAEDLDQEIARQEEPRLKFPSTPPNEESPAVAPGADDRVRADRPGPWRLRGTGRLVQEVVIPEAPSKEALNNAGAG